MSKIVRKNASVNGWSQFENWSESTSPTNKIDIYQATNMPTIIREVAINDEITTPKSVHDVTTPMKTFM